MPQVDVITGEARHRRWTLEQKQSIVAAAFAPGANRAEITRRANISSGQLYTWRKELSQGFGPSFSEIVAKDDQAPRVGRFMPMNDEDPAAGVELNTGKLIIRFSPDTPPELATAVLNALVIR